MHSETAPFTVTTPRSRSSSGSTFFYGMLLRRQTSTCLCWLAGAGSVSMQALQDAFGKQLDVPVGLWVRVNVLQLVQAALLQQHAAVARRIFAAHMLHGPGSPQLDTGCVKTLQQREEWVKRPVGHHFTLRRGPLHNDSMQLLQQ